MSEIYEQSLFYRICRKYILFSFKRYFRKITVTGKENIPDIGPVIYAPNHRNALLDALVIGMIASKRHSTIFLARSDLFRKPFIARLLRFTKIMPAYRIRDGYENLGKNAGVFNQAIEVLKHNNALCIMPEGNQELEQKVRPLVKGLIRIALDAQKQIGYESNIKIIPVGLYYEDLIKFGRNLIVNIGKPINIRDYLTEHELNPAKTVNDIRDRLKSSLSHLTIDISSEDNYHLFEDILNIIPDIHNRNNSDVNDDFQMFQLRKRVVSNLLKIENESPEQILILKSLCKKYTEIYCQLQLKNFDLKVQKKGLLAHSARNLYFLITLPVFLTGFLLNVFPFLTPVYLRKKLGVKQRHFYSSVYYGAGLITFPFYYIIQSSLIIVLLNSPWVFGFLFIPLQYYAGKFAFYGWILPVKKHIHSLNFNRFKNKQKSQYKELRKTEKLIIEMVLK